MDTIINFETAKILKKIKFNEKCLRTYRPNGTISPFDDITDLEEILTQYEDLEDYLYCKNSELGSEYCSAPTISQVVMWLYKKYGIWVSVTSISQESWQAHMCRKGDTLGKCYLEDFESPTEAYQEAISYVLKNLI